MRAAGLHWSLGARWPSSDRVAAWSFTGLLAAAAPTHVPHKWQGAVDVISQEPQQLPGIVRRAPEHLHNNCRPDPVRSLTSTLLCNANWKIDKKQTNQKKMHRSNLSLHFTRKLKASSRFLSACYFPHEHSLPRPTFLSARPSSEHLPCAREKTRHRGVLQIYHATSILHTTDNK